MGLTWWRVVNLLLVVGLLVVVNFLLLMCLLVGLRLVVRRLVVVAHLAALLLVTGLGGPGGPGRGDPHQTADVTRQGDHYVLDVSERRPGLRPRPSSGCGGLKVAAHDTGLALC